MTINGKSYRSTVAVMGGKFMVGVSAENRKIVGVAAGDKKLDHSDEARAEFEELERTDRSRVRSSE